MSLDSSLRIDGRAAVVVGWLVVALVAAGCQSSGTTSQSARRHKRSSEPAIRRVVCLYDQRPWLNLDKQGDRDAEGIAFRVFLDAGNGRGVLRDGTFHVEMYRRQRGENDEWTRELVSDWHYPTQDIPTIAQPGMLGNGYFLHLRWASKNIAGSEVEIVTFFEDSQGRKVRSGTKLLRVPKYDT
jgi:hypothetical protein